MDKACGGPVLRRPAGGVTGRALPPETYGDRLADRTDSALIRRLRCGDMEAASTLFVRHHPSALRAARSIGNADVAEDLVSEAFTKVLTAILEGRGPDRAFRAYLVTTIRHLFVDVLRKGAHEVPVGDTLDLPQLASPDRIDDLVAEHAMAEALAGLPERWREVLQRTVVWGQPLAEVGACMGIHPNAVAALSHRARRGLARALQDAGPGQDSVVNV